MNKIKTLFFNLFTNKEKEKELKENIWNVKSLFKTFFEIYYKKDGPITIPEFQITEFAIEFLTEEIIVDITLENPHILIGKESKTINALTKFLSERTEQKVTINIFKSKIWSK